MRKIFVGLMTLCGFLLRVLVIAGPLAIVLLMDLSFWVRLVLFLGGLSTSRLLLREITAHFGFFRALFEVNIRRGNGEIISDKEIKELVKEAKTPARNAMAENFLKNFSLIFRNISVKALTIFTL